MVHLTRERFGAWALLGVGIVLVAVLPEAIGQSLSSDALLALSVVGGVVVWAGATWDDVICRRYRDERVAEIHYRAGYNTALAFSALLGTLIFVVTNLDRSVSVAMLTGVLFGSLAVYFGTVAWLKRQM
ncbi:MAG: hypothetical protein ABEI27_05845 [Halobellus sp.]|uniref:hypothetical protein n=1 Tax=Halobellus sp. TaxID=1979212 RepID=UPI0035D44BAA